MNLSDNRLHIKDFFKNGSHIRVEKRCADSFPWHSHEYFEIEIILSGCGSMRLNDKEYPLKKGSVYLLTPADFHGIICTQPLEQWNLSFDETVPNPAWIDKLFQLRTPFRIVTEETLSRLDNATQLIKEEAVRSAFVGPLLEYLLKTADLWEDETESLSPIRRAILYAETYFRDSPSLSDAAEHACLSPSYFASLFHETTGETYVSYLNRCKVNCAMMLLKNGHTVTEACFDSGFGSLSGFRYVFRQKTGMTPTEYAESVSFPRPSSD